MKDASMEGLLLRLPDALFDSAWLNTEYYQRERPPQPFFAEYVFYSISDAIELLTRQCSQVWRIL